MKDQIAVTKISRWKTRVGFATVLVTGIVIAYLMMRADLTPKRNEFISPFVGPVTSKALYRCRFTVSEDWQKRRPTLEQSSDVSDLVGIEPLPSPFKQWIDSHLFHRPPMAPTCIFLNHSTLQGDPGSFLVVGGYPDLPAGSQEPRVQKHYRIGPYPATLFQLQIAQGGASYSLTLFYVYIPEADMVFILSSVTEPAEATALDREMQAIIASYHVEKAVEPEDKKN